MLEKKEEKICYLKDRVREKDQNLMKLEKYVELFQYTSNDDSSEKVSSFNPYDKGEYMILRTVKDDAGPRSAFRQTSWMQPLMRCLTG